MDTASYHNHHPLIALVDCNNFYVSCERVFDPSLRNKPVIVLSNNDGCVISRSNEAKELGIPMAAPLYQCRPLIEKHNIQVRSSNFVLYGDMSRRVMRTIESLVVPIEIYSIDEAFVSLDGYQPKRAYELGKSLRKRILQWTGIPVSIGISRTKTLAKVAGHKAKKNELYRGVCLLDSNDPTLLHEALETTKVSDVWGIGRKHSVSLSTRGILSAADLVMKNDIWVRKNLSITGLKTVWELRGTPCLSLEHVSEKRKTIISSRSFHHPVLSFSDLNAAIANYVNRACEKLREQQSVAHTVTIYIRTSYFHLDKPQYKNAITITLPVPSSFTPDFLHAASKALRQIFQSGFEYKKAGIVLSGLVPEGNAQQSWLDVPVDPERTGALMRVYDKLHHKYGGKSLFFAAQGTKRSWETRQIRRSNSYTTDIAGVLKVGGGYKV